MSDYDKIDNLSLIENGLHHVQFELSRTEPSYFRLARESHIILYRSMIEALKGTANLAVTGRPSKHREHIYKLGEDPWKKIYKIPIKNCKNAWRFSEAEFCDEPTIDRTHKDPQRIKREDYLIPFYDALAMIQSECFMCQLVFSEIVTVSDEDMKTLEWLHEQIRNVYEHFIPSSYLAPVRELLIASILCLTTASRALFESKNVIYHKENQEKTLKRLFKQILTMLEYIKEDSHS